MRNLIAGCLLLAALGVGIGAQLGSDALVARAVADDSGRTGTPGTDSSPIPSFLPSCPGDVPLVATRGPYVVFRERIEADRSSVFVYDVGLGKYWIAVERAPLTEVLLAGERLIVWSGDRVLSVGLHGYTDRVLFEHREIQELRVSPDMSKLAISYGRPLNLVLLSIGSGDELLRVEADDPQMLSLRQVGWGSADNPGRLLRLGEWSRDSDALSLRAGRVFEWSDRYPGVPEPQQLAILSLEGDLSVLPAGWLLSPGLRYALNPGELLTARRFWETDRYLWREFDVVDIENGELLWTIELEQGQGIIPTDPSVWGRWGDAARVVWGPDQERLVYLEYGERLPDHVYQSLAEAAGRTWQAWYLGKPNSGVKAYVLDLESGNKRELSQGEWIDLEGGDTLVSRPCLYSRRGYNCLLTVDGQVIWRGSPQVIGVIEPQSPVIWPGLVLREQEQLGSLPHSRPTGEIIGPLVAYELQTAEWETSGSPGTEWYRRSQVILHDAGAGRTWSALVRRAAFGEPFSFGFRLARNGFVLIDGDILRFADLTGVSRSVLFDEPLGERESLLDVLVSPNGRHIAVVLRRDERPHDYVHPGEGNSPSAYTLQIIEISTAEAVVRVDFDSEYPRSQDPASYTFAWNEEGTALGVTGWRYEGKFWAGTAYPETGTFRKPPAKWYQVDDISPDFRHGLRVWLVDRDEYVLGHLGYGDRDEPTQLHVFDYLSNTAVWRSEVFEAAQEASRRAWHSPDHVVWIQAGDRAYFDAGQSQVMNVSDDTVIMVANISTGEAEMMYGGEYLEWIDSDQPEPQYVPVIDCPVDRAQLCRLLLDDAVIGEGRWLRVMGQVPFD